MVLEEWSIKRLFVFDVGVVVVANLSYRRYSSTTTGWKKHVTPRIRCPFKTVYLINMAPINIISNSYSITKNSLQTPASAPNTAQTAGCSPPWPPVQIKTATASPQGSLTPTRSETSPDPTRTNTGCTWPKLSTRSSATGSRRTPRPRSRSPSRY